MNVTHYFAPVALAAAALIASPASAALVVNANGSVTVSGTSGGTASVNFGGNSDGANVPGLTSTLSLTFVEAVSGTYRFNYTLTNTSTAPTTSSRVGAFGFNTDPNITSASIISGSVFDEIRYNANMPNGMANVEVCFTTHNCTGSGGEGVTIGQSTFGTFDLKFGSTNLSTLTLDNLAVRYQSINAPGIQGGSGTGGMITAVPEPGTWALMLIGFGAIGSAMRRRRSQKPILQLA